ncbi:MAG: hypothetical protein GVY04_20435 [Cyanobacteria bacterium]|jgi:hypothetical protein|nr:hypothetical protein [Cyanobacteria bacterium GSL.Bin1]
MKMQSLRKLHRRVAPILFLPLLLSASTGVLFRVARSWFGASKETGEIIMYFHQGSFFGHELKVFYVILNGLGVLVMLSTGIMMTGLWKSDSKN